MPTPCATIRNHLFVLGVYALAPFVARAQRPLNLSFDKSSVADSTQPWGWSLGWSAFAAGGTARFSLDTVNASRGTRSLRIIASDTIVGAITSDTPARGMLLQLPADFARGRVLTLTGSVRVATQSGRVVVSLEAWGDRVVLAADSAKFERAVQTSGGDSPWRQFRLRIVVPRDLSIHSIVINPAVQGAGTAWFDDFALTRDNVRLDVVPGVSPPTAAQQRWLATRSAALSTVRLSSVAERNQAHGDADLALFDKIVGNARVVGLGESTHGTSEFFQLKHRLISHLVVEHGVRLFALEANQRTVQRLDQFVRGGAGTTADALRSVFAVWNTEEMGALVTWLRDFNAAHVADPVRIVGYDMQDHRTPIDSLLSFLQTRDSTLRTQIDARTREYRAHTSFATPQVVDSTRSRWLRDAEWLVSSVTSAKSSWLNAARTREDSIRVQWAEHDADLYRQAARLNATLASPDRDSLMAANLAWTLRVEYPQARAVVWAHDVHVSRGGDKKRSFNGGAQMGAVLAKHYGVDYRAFSLLTRDGAYRATKGLSDYRMINAAATPAPRGSVESMLSALPRPKSSPGVIVDLRVRERDTAAAWLWLARPIRHIGYAAYDYGFELSAVMPLEFDGVILIEHTTPSQGLRPRS